ncbi:hypothetical protein CBL_02624 [Carabus blaptoides fortunei]
MLVHQLRIVKLNDVHHKEGGDTSLYITEECQQILKAVLDRELQQKYVNTALLGYTLTSLRTNEEPRMQTFKQKIKEQLKYLGTTSNELKKIDEEQIKVMEESITLRKEIMITQYMYQEQLRIRREQIKQQQNTPSNSAYSEQLNTIKKRVNKINFMSTIISRLLIFGRIDWEENKDLAQLIEKYRTRYTVE